MALSLQRENLPVVLYLLYNELNKMADLEFEVIVVDDNSPDGTGDVARTLSELFPSLRVIGRDRKRGLGSAYRHGLKFCMGALVMIMDVDLSHHPRDAPKLLRRQRETQCDIVAGNRYGDPSGVEGGITGWDMRRKITSRGAHMLILPFSPPFTDPTGSFRVYKREVLSKLCKVTQSDGFCFQVESAILAGRLGYKTDEVPITFVNRVLGESKLGLGEYQRYVSLLWSMVWRGRGDKAKTLRKRETKRQ
ncbi:hypothetical protein KIPB_006239 [Kipferlia bialata]|uniref:Dolichol-phosphate mannosyltransferase subunit 1 n=1 Tax=Kipferlia bialata TaxID=797122 RepID=A0A9K3CWS3_9EUKA|nr:hypothetical protein KIPB_003790 [Kipferlia bialata]GIQ84693.1 hypothetical protein KIPB_006239 [Kipferlia bialata]|eukprot:g3790.t1